MLRRLSVENYALIDKLELELDPHLNIITGETGAGKSILLGALGLLLGAKNDGSAMKDAARSCTVEGTFALAGPELEEFFAENDLEYAAETTLTRIITPAGKSRAFVNDVPVSLAQLREVGTRLLDIHSQHQNLILSSEEFRTSALDTVAGNGELLAQYAAQYTRLTELRRRLAALREAAADGRRDEEWLRFQSEELTAANLREGEQAAIEEELAVREPSVIISRRPCALLKYVKHNPPLVIDPSSCRGCKACLKLGCPAIRIQDGKAAIDDTLCVGCGLCKELCRFHAIGEKGEAK